MAGASQPVWMQKSQHSGMGIAACNLGHLRLTRSTARNRIGRVSGVNKTIPKMPSRWHSGRHRFGSPLGPVVFGRVHYDISGDRIYLRKSAKNFSVKQLEGRQVFHLYPQ